MTQLQWHFTLALHICQPYMEKNMKHTPGPWEAKVCINKHGGWRSPSQEVNIGNGNSLIATYNTDYMEYPSDEENEANARLIAKAPEMYELLKQATSYVENSNISGCHALNGDIINLLMEIDNEET